MAKHTTKIAVFAALVLMPILSIDGSNAAASELKLGEKVSSEPAKELTPQQKDEIRECVMTMDDAVNLQHPFKDGTQKILSDSPDPKVRKAYARLLQMGPGITRELCTYVDQLEKPMRYDVAAIVIEKLNNRNAVIDAILEHDIKTVNGGMALLNCCLNHGMFDGTKLFKLLRSKDPQKRIMALEVIDNYRDKDVDWTVGPFTSPKTAVQTIEAIRPIILADPDEEVRSSAVWALSGIWRRDRNTIDSLRASDARNHDKRLPAFLQFLSDNKISSRISSLLGEVVLRGQDEDVRAACVRSLAEFPSGESVPILITLGRQIHDPAVDRVIAISFAKSIDRSAAGLAIPLLLDWMSSPDDDLRTDAWAVVDCLCKSGHKLTGDQKLRFDELSVAHFARGGSADAKDGYIDQTWYKYDPAKTIDQLGKSTNSLVTDLIKKE